MDHQWRLRRNYQFPNAAATIQDGDAYFGWAVNAIGNPEQLYGVVRYVVDGDRVAWKESPGHFNNSRSAASEWLMGTISQIKAAMKTEEREKQVKGLIADALSIDGAHHKQWYLWKIAEALSIDLSDLWSEESPEPDRGIAP